MSNLFFTSDTHFGHENVIKYTNRPFTSVEEMNETLIENWNNVVAPNDMVYHLGDVSFRGDPAEYLSQLNGQIYVLRGNHDSKSKLNQCRDAGIIQWWGDVKYVRFAGERFFCSHYAHRTWKGSNRGVYHLYGHSHGDLEPYNRSIDVGVDVWDYTPVTWMEVRDLLKGETYTNHHVERVLS